MGIKSRVIISNGRTLSQTELKKAHQILIHAYAMTEVEIWGENYERISFENFMNICQEGFIYVAKIDSEIVGSISIQAIKNKNYTFGLLASDFTRKGQGIGKELINKAEALAKENGAQQMQIEVLTPDNVMPEFKKILIEYYQKMGYKITETIPFVDLKPKEAEKSKTLVTPSSFVCMVKDVL